MNRLLALLSAVGMGVALFVGCAPQPVVQGDDDDKGGSSCPGAQTLCGNECVTLAANNTHCGTCGLSCGVGTSCVNGQCSCQQGTAQCSGQCLNLGADPSNCGACAHACAFGQQCTTGACQCQVGLTACGTGCTNVTSDPANCGVCNTICPATAAFCSNSVCKTGCDAPLMACGQACVNTTTDIANCGACGQRCAGVGQTCNNGVCGCPVGQGACSAAGACVDVTANAASCGTCGNACTGGRACVGGACACPAGQAVCGTGCVPTGTCGAGGSGGTSGAAGSGFGGTGGASGGTAGTGGSSTTGGSAGSSTGGTGGGGGTAPPGYWTFQNWHGCTWTGIDIVAGTTTTNTPRDFTMHQNGTGYCVSGSVNANYDSVALMGFNLAEPISGSATQCAYNPAAATQMGPPGVTLTGSGIAVNFTKSTAATLRIQIQGPNGATDANNRWCYTITPAAGPVFAPFSAFNTKCWDGTGTAYAGAPISAVVFLVPGTMGAATPFNYCITGFNTGAAATDAPTWGTGTTGPLTGTIGGPGGMNLDFQRVKVAKGGKSYIIQNNNWGNPNGSDQTITYSDNSFTVVSSTGNGSSAPASFPSIYIGANGDTQGGTYTTTSDDHLPKQISLITSLMTTFRVNRAGPGEYNVAYDVWFSANNPPPAGYMDGVSGFVMVWLYDPPNHQPIGSVVRQANGIAGHDWDVWVGPRGSGPSPNAPVVSYVVRGGAITSMVNFNLKDFITNAAQNGIQSAWYLTDVFGGFEIWTGANGAGLQVQEFTAVVAP